MPLSTIASSHDACLLPTQMTKFLLLAFVMIAPVSARIGDTKPQLVTRYGRPMIDTEDAPEFKKNGLWIKTKIIGQSCQYLSIANDSGDATKPFSPPQIGALLESAAPGKKWQRDGQGYKTADGSLTATLSSPGLIEVHTKDSLALQEKTEPSTTTEPPPPAPKKLASGNPPTLVEIMAKTSSAGASRNKKWETYWGSYDRDIYRERLVSINLRASTGGPATVEVHWIGSEVEKSGPNKVVDLTKEEVVLPTANPLDVELGSLFVESDTKYVALGRRERKGIKYAGWVVRVVDANGAVLATQGSRPPLIALVK